MAKGLYCLLEYLSMLTIDWLVLVWFYIMGDKILPWGTPYMSALDFDNVQFLNISRICDSIWY